MCARSRLWAVVGLCCSLISASCQRAQSDPRKLQMVAQLKQSYHALPVPQSLGPLRLLTAKGRAFELPNLQGRWSLVVMGYTSCPDVCPTILGILGRALATADRSGTDEPLQVMFLSVDPERDAPERLEAYVAYFHPDLIPLTAERAQLDAFVEQLGGSYRIAEHAPNENYAVDHSTSVFLIDPRATVVGTFDHPASAEKLLEDLRRVLDAGRDEALLP